MAEELDEWPKDIKIGRGGGSRRFGNYNWDLWLNGDVWEITQGEDFLCAPKTMRRQVNFSARKRNLKVRTIIPRNTNTIILQMIPGVNGSNKK